MPPEVLDAWRAAAGCFVDLLELQDRVGERIAQRIGVEAALVTSGAAGGIVLGTAAALTYRNPERIGSLPLQADARREVIRQKTHRDEYDQQVFACGVEWVEVKTLADLESAIGSRTAMMFAYNLHESAGSISHRDWIAVAQRYAIPTLLDAAADTPPVEALRYYNDLGFDMVVFSGGKALRGPQDTGLLLGRRDLIAAAKQNTSPHGNTIGRAMKVGKEDLVALWAAVERYLHLDHAAEKREWERRLEVIERRLAEVPTVITRRIEPPVANRFPHLLIHWDEQRIQLGPTELRTKLAAGQPSIATARVHGTGDDGFLVSVVTLQPGEETIVAARLYEFLSRAAD
ncbi:MAG: hypothetical protein RIS70_3400 [Planctomycetota bacterium]